MEEIKWYENNTLDMIKNTIKSNMNTACSSFNAIGYYLKNVRDRELYTQDGYNSIWDFARAEFGISKSSASRFMAINDKFSVDGNSPVLLEEYKQFSSSKLSEMLTLTDSQLDQVKPEMTRDQIRELKPKKEKVIAPVEQESDEIVLEQKKKPILCIQGKHFAFKCPQCGQVIFYGQSCCMDFDWTSFESYKPFSEQPIAPAQQKDKEKETGTHQVLEISPLSQEEQKEYKRCTHKADNECNIKGCSDVARDLGMECNGICCWECKEREECGAACNVSAHERRQQQSVIKKPISVINGQENVIDAEFTEVEDHIVHFDFDVENYGGNWEESIYRFINQANSKRFNYAHDDIERKYLEDVGKNLKELVELKKKQQVIAKKEQPELPRLRNNDQRKEFIDNYTTWPVWIDQPLTEERYYRYDLSSKVAMVVKVSRKHGWENYKESKNFEYAAEQYYLLGMKTEYRTSAKYEEDPTRTFYECCANKSTLIDYLKEFQKE